MSTDPTTILAAIPAPDPARALWTNDPPRTPEELAQRLPHWAMATLGNLLRLRDAAKATGAGLRARHQYHGALQLAASQAAALLGYSYTPKDLPELYRLLKPVADLAGGSPVVARNQRYNPPDLSDLCTALYHALDPDEPRDLHELAHRIGRSSSRGLYSAMQSLLAKALAAEPASGQFVQRAPTPPEPTR